MRHSDLTVTTPPPIPGVVDGTLTMRVAPDRGISFHVTVGSDRDAAMRRVHVEFILSAEYATIIRDALAGDAGLAALPAVDPSVPCCIGILVDR